MVLLVSGYSHFSLSDNFNFLGWLQSSLSDSYRSVGWLQSSLCNMFILMGWLQCPLFDRLSLVVWLECPLSEQFWSMECVWWFDRETSCPTLIPNITDESRCVVFVKKYISLLQVPRINNAFIHFLLNAEVQQWIYNFANLCDFQTGCIERRFL